MINTAIFNVKSIHRGIELGCRNWTTFESFAWFVNYVRNPLPNVTSNICWDRIRYSFTFILDVWSFLPWIAFNLARSYKRLCAGLIQVMAACFLTILVKDGCTIQRLSFFKGDLLIDVILTSFPLLLLQQQVVSRGNLVVLVVLDKSLRLFQIFPWKMVFEQFLNIINHWDFIDAYDYSFHIIWFDFCEPFMLSDFLNSDSVFRLGVQNSFGQVFEACWQTAW